MDEGFETGTIKWFSGEKGYGFIEQDNGSQDVFLHYSDLSPTDKTTIDKGDRVAFTLGDNNGRPKAVEVRRI